MQFGGAHVRRTVRQLLLVGVISLIVSLPEGVFNSARAYHTERERLLDSTAYSLHRNELRLGVMELAYGAIDQLQITTYTAPWILGAILENVAPNLELKSTFYDRRRLALSVSFATIWGRVDQADDTRVGYLVFPVGLAASTRINRSWSSHVGGFFTFTKALGDSDPADNEVKGVVIVDMLQLWAMLEYRASRVVALTFTIRWLPYVSNAVAEGTVMVDENTDAQVGLETDITSLDNEFAVIPGVVFSWARANLRVGVGYGALFVEGVGLVVPDSISRNITGEFDLFVRF